MAPGLSVDGRKMPYNDLAELCQALAIEERVLLELGVDAPTNVLFSLAM
jgi:hypothetical protein